MNRAQALTAAAKLLGVSKDRLELRERPDQPSIEEQARLSEELKAHRAAPPTPPPPTPEMLAYREEYRKWKERERELVGLVITPRREIFTTDGLGLTPKVRGDTWADCIEALKAKKAAAT